MQMLRALCVGVEGVWWSPRSSKPLRPDRVGLGGFDSHTLPPARRMLGLACAVMLLAAPLGAQRQEGTRAGVSLPSAAQASDTVSVAIVAPENEPKPLITPGRAFRLSLVFPGAGQAQLDRPYAGGVFLLIEAISLAMLHRSAEDLQLARSFRGDSMPARYQVDATTGLAARDTLGNPLVAEWDVPRYTDAWVRTRRLHLEDWMAVLIFNHLFAGADAYVAAQLWDLPGKVALRQLPFGPAVAYTLQFGRGPRR
jgi:hypothetical protein